MTGSNKSLVIAIISLILALGSFSYIMYDSFLAPKEQSDTQLTGMYYTYLEGPFYQASSLTEIPNFQLNFSLKAGETGHFLFTAVVEVNSSDNAFTQIAFMLNGSIVPGGYITLQIPDVGAAENYTLPISMTYTAYAASDLSYTLSIGTISFTPSAMYKCELIVQTFKVPV